MRSLFTFSSFQLFYWMSNPKSCALNAAVVRATRELWRLPLGFSLLILAQSNMIMPHLLPPRHNFSELSYARCHERSTCVQFTNGECPCGRWRVWRGVRTSIHGFYTRANYILVCHGSGKANHLSTPLQVPRGCEDSTGGHIVLSRRMKGAVAWIGGLCWNGQRSCAQLLKN